MIGTGWIHGGDSNSLVVEEDVSFGLDRYSVGRISCNGIISNKIAHLLIFNANSLKGCDVESVPVNISSKLHVNVENVVHRI